MRERARLWMTAQSADGGNAMAEPLLGQHTASRRLRQSSSPRRTVTSRPHQGLGPLDALAAEGLHRGGKHAYAAAGGGAVVLG